ncbi:MAG: hypothetical protein Harvfovirus79_6, partial [Harvfovirus sp.]
AVVVYMLGYYHYFGLGVGINYSVAFDYFQKGVELGDPEAMYMVGESYYFGHGRIYSGDHGLSWYIRSSDLGNTKAMIKIGLIYANGYGVEKSLDGAIHWYKKCADLGDAEGLFHLACTYESFATAKTDLIALKYYFKASNANLSDAGSNRCKNALEKLCLKYKKNIVEIWMDATNENDSVKRETWQLLEEIEEEKEGPGYSLTKAHFGSNYS